MTVVFRETGSADYLAPRIFGRMAEIAFAYVKNYHSDLYHDVHFLDEILENIPVTKDNQLIFYFAVDEDGTGIVLEPALYTGRTYLYKFVLAETPWFGWELTVTTTENKHLV